MGVRGTNTMSRTRTYPGPSSGASSAPASTRPVSSPSRERSRRSSTRRTLGHGPTVDPVDTVAAAAGPAAPTKTGERYPALDGLRAIAVLCVVMTHIGFQTGETFRGSVGALLARLDFGVTIFF